MSEGPQGRSVSTFGKLLPFVLAAWAVAMAVFGFLVTRHPGALVLPLVYLVALVTMAWTAAGRTLVARIGLGLVMVGAALAFMVMFFVEGGRNPTSLMFGAILLLGSVAVILLGLPGLAGPTSVVDWFPLLAAAAAVLMTAVAYLSTRNLGSLVFGGLFMATAVVTMIAAGATGPRRFGLGLVAVAGAVGLIYFAVISGAGVPMIVFGAVVLLSAGQLLTAGVRPAPDQ
ncbi:hypothetical protein [Alloactinosynnema sp. L-07]|uniref:hypothetical protein n=1 Tax=Alloactinosynnema sp. L-07 TaxID=1653480 RepID=UPI00065EF946|nr:hypothetical protein [Alloactinosynnema sp. L-07]CRK59983.1 hypothetical protein [Alloactinosynnema sp. L-07]